MTLAASDAQYGSFDGPGGLGYGRPPIAPYGSPLGGFGGAPGAFGAPLGGLHGGFGGAPIGGPLGGFGGAPIGGPLGGFGGPIGGPLGGFGGAPIGGPLGGFGGAPYGAPLGGAGFGRPVGGFGGGYGAPPNYQFGYGVQGGDHYGASTFGHNEERNAYGTVGQYHVNTPGSFQFVNYNVAGGAQGYGAGPIPAYV